MEIDFPRLMFNQFVYWGVMKIIYPRLSMSLWSIFDNQQVVTSFGIQKFQHWSSLSRFSCDLKRRRFRRSFPSELHKAQGVIMELVYGEKVSFLLLIKSRLRKLFQIHAAGEWVKYLKYLWGIRMMKISRESFASQRGLKEFRTY
jgi:hypothetical protein